MTRADILQRQVEGKFSPIASFVVTLMRGKTFIGDDVSVKKEAGLRLVPMVAQDTYDLVKENPHLLPLVAFALYGGGIQTYGPRKKKEKKYTINAKKYGGEKKKYKINVKSYK